MATLSADAKMSMEVDLVMMGLITDLWHMYTYSSRMHSIQCTGKPGYYVHIMFTMHYACSPYAGIAQLGLYLPAMTHLSKQKQSGGAPRGRFRRLHGLNGPGF